MCILFALHIKIELLIFHSTLTTEAITAHHITSSTKIKLYLFFFNEKLKEEKISIYNTDLARKHTNRHQRLS